MASIEPRTNDKGEKSYRVKVRLKGYPAQSATFDRLTDAKKWAAATESSIREGRHFKTAEAKKHSIGDMLTRYYSEVLPHYNEKEQKERKGKLEWWRQAIGHCSLADVTPAAITEHKAKMTQSAATVDKYLKNLSHAFTVAVNDWGWLEDNPVKKVKSPKLPRGRVRFLDDAERERLLTACQQSSNKQLYLCVILALSTGMRQGELMGLKWQDVNLKDGFIILHETKNGERRRVPLAGHGLELLREHVKVRRLDTDLLFPGTIHAHKPIDLRKPFENTLQVAQINDFHWHDLRHCTASYLAMNGASLAEIAEVLGHKTLAMVKRYAHLSDGHVSNVVASMNAKIFGGAVMADWTKEENELVDEFVRNQKGHPELRPEHLEPTSEEIMDDSVDGFINWDAWSKWKDITPEEAAHLAFLIDFRLRQNDFSNKPWFPIQGELKEKILEKTRDLINIRASLKIQRLPAAIWREAKPLE